MPGVKHVVKVGNSAVAVVAERWWQAKTALGALPATWDEGENTKVSSATIAESLKGGLDAEQAFVGNEHGDVKQAIANAAKKVEAIYAYPYQNHATMEPMNTTERFYSRCRRDRRHERRPCAPCRQIADARRAQDDPMRSP
jgi:isoquinoline 1-oxidoreductase subunit beta